MGIFMKTTKKLIALSLTSAILSGCTSGGGLLTATEAMSKLEDAGVACAEKTDWGSFGTSVKGFSCKDFADSFTGFRMSFGDDAQDFKSSLSDYCLERGDSISSEQGIFGDNWVATIDDGSNVEFSDLSKALGGNLITFQEACS